MIRNFDVSRLPSDAAGVRDQNLNQARACRGFACTYTFTMRDTYQAEAERVSGLPVRKRVIWIIFVSFRLILYTICATVVSFSRLVVFTTPAGKHKSVLFCRFCGLPSWARPPYAATVRVSHGLTVGNWYQIRRAEWGLPPIYIHRSMVLYIHACTIRPFTFSWTNKTVALLFWNFTPPCFFIVLRQIKSLLWLCN